MINDDISSAIESIKTKSRDDRNELAEKICASANITGDKKTDIVNAFSDPDKLSDIIAEVGYADAALNIIQGFALSEKDPKKADELLLKGLGSSANILTWKAALIASSISLTGPAAFLFAMGLAFKYGDKIEKAAQKNEFLREFLYNTDNNYRYSEADIYDSTWS